MPVHDWARVNAGVFHAFHHCWITAISGALNLRVLPTSCYAPPVQIAGVLGTTVAVRNIGNHHAVARVEVLLPWQKNNPSVLSAFVRNAREALTAGTHLLLVDLFPSGPHGTQWVHRAIWGEDCGAGPAQPGDNLLTCVAYVGGPGAEAFIESVAVGDPLPDMPLFLSPGVSVRVPLEATYLSAWESLPAYWRDVLTGAAGEGEQP